MNSTSNSTATNSTKPMNNAMQFLDEMSKKMPSGYRQNANFEKFVNNTFVNPRNKNGTEKGEGVRGNLTFEIDAKHFSKNIPLAWNSTSGAQIDDLIGSQKWKPKALGNSTANSTAEFFFQHFVNWSPSGSVASGNQVVLYATYMGWDKKSNSTASNLLNQQATFSLNNDGTASIAYETSTGVALGKLANVTVGNFRGDVDSDDTFKKQGVYTPANGTNWATFSLAIAEDPSSAAKSRVKVGDTVNYKVGWRLYNSTTNATAATTSESTLQTWTLTDGASALSAAMSVAAVISFVSF